MSADHRPVPNFFLVGAPKAGTTSLYRYLDQHPAVYMSPIKEPCFFAPEVVDFSPRTREYFEAHESEVRAYLEGPMRTKGRGIVLQWDEYLELFRHVGHETAVGEASASYLGSLGAPAAIRARIPDARIIMLLRDPADRLFSHYSASRETGATRVSFMDWVDELSAAEATRHPPIGPIWAGRYATHLQRYLQTFPAAQVRAYLGEDYAPDPGRVLADVFAFLGVDPTWPIDTRRRHNVTLVPRWPVLHRMLRPVTAAIRATAPSSVVERARTWWRVPSRRTATPAERARALELYSGEIRTLETLLDRDLSAWLDPR